jgi:hypothetical protein
MVFVRNISSHSDAEVTDEAVRDMLFITPRKLVFWNCPQGWIFLWVFCPSQKMFSSHYCWRVVAVTFWGRHLFWERQFF